MSDPDLARQLAELDDGALLAAINGALAARQPAAESAVTAAESAVAAAESAAVAAATSAVADTDDEYERYYPKAGPR